MKEKWYRLTNRHRWIPVAITILFIALWLLLLWKVGALAELERDEMISFYIAAGVMLLCSLVAGSACSSYLMNPTVKSLNNQCDPFPLLAECEDQFTYVKNKDAEYGGAPHEVSGMLLYAKTDEQIQPDHVYHMSGNKISVRTLDLNCSFEEIAHQLNKIVAEHFVCEVI